VERFLLENNFILYKIKGSHVHFVGGTRVVVVPKHTSKTIKIKTMSSIINQSGITKEK